MTNLISILDKNNYVIASKLYNLFKRGFVTRIKEKNCHSTSFRRMQFNYSISNNGIEILKKNLENLSKDRHQKIKVLKEKKSDEVNLSLGSNQEVILNVILDKGSSFLGEIIESTNFDSRTANKSLTCLVRRGIIIRNLEYNPYSKWNNPNQYKYYPSELGKSYIKNLKK